MDTRNATTDFTQFYTEWHSIVTSAVLKAGFRNQDADDLVQNIFCDLYRGGYLDKYDPERAAFSTYIWGHVNVRIRGRKRDLWKRGQREFIPTANADGTSEFPDPADPADPFAETCLNMAVESIYKELQALPATESKNLARLFRDIVKMIVTEGEFSQTRLARKYGCSRQAISYQVQDLARTSALQKLKELTSA